MGGLIESPGVIDLLQPGFDAFSFMKGTDEFLETVITRETALMKELFANPDARCPV